MSKNLFKEKNLKFITFIVLTLIIFTGLIHVKDFGMIPDERNQVIAGHVIFKFIFPEYCKNHQILEDTENLMTYDNRYYGQASTFPTVLVEAYKGFSSDEANVILMRHYWNFLLFSGSLFLLALFLHNRFHTWSASLIGVLSLSLFPRIIGDSFTNDRDILVLVWIIAALYEFEVFTRKLDWLHLVLFAAASAFAINTRYYGFILIIPVIILFFKNRNSRKYLLASLLICSLIFLLISPTYWINPLHSFIDSFRSFITRREADTQGKSATFFFGKNVFEEDLPWYYLPVWILITSPFLYLILCSASLLIQIKNFFKNKKQADSCAQTIDLSVFCMFLIPIIAECLIRPTLYNGWRHFYFLAGFIVFETVWFFDFVINDIQKNQIKLFFFMSLLISYCVTGIWIIQNHPYESVYFTPLFQKYTAYNFERDYWRHSTKECLEYIVSNSTDERITVWDYHAETMNIFYSLKEPQRGRISAIRYGLGGEPADFIIADIYDGPKDSLIFPFYTPVFYTFMNGIKLGTVYKRDSTDKIEGGNMIAWIRSNINNDKVGFVYDADKKTAWSTDMPQKEGDYLDIMLDKSHMIYGLTLFSQGGDNQFPHSLEIETSNDFGKTWVPANNNQKGFVDFSFAPINTNEIKLSITQNDKHPWCINDIWIYGK